MNPLLARNGGVIQKLKQGCRCIAQLRKLLLGPAPERLKVCRGLLQQGMFFDWSVIGKSRGRHLSGDGTVMQHPHNRFLEDLAHNRRLQAPATEALHQGVLPAGLHHEQHPFLGFRQQELVSRHPGFTGRNTVQIQFHPQAPFGSHFRTAAGETSGTHVLRCHHITTGEGLKAGFDQPFLQKRIAHLHGGAIIQGIGTELSTGKAGSPHAVPTGGAAHVHHRIADADRTGFDDLLGLHQAKGHGIHQRIAGIGRIKSHLATHRRHPNAVAVMGNAGHNAFHQANVGGILKWAEAQSVQQRDRTGPHREDVTQDAAHPCGRPLKGFDGGGVVVAFDLEGQPMAPTEIHHTSVFAGSNKDAWSLRGETTQQRPGIAITAVFGPHHTEHAQFGSIRLAAETPTDLIPVTGLEPFLLQGCSYVVRRGGNHESRSTSPQCCRPPVRPRDLRPRGGGERGAHPSFRRPRLQVLTPLLVHPRRRI